VAPLGETEHAQKLLDARAGLLLAQTVDLSGEKQVLLDSEVVEKAETLFDSSRITEDKKILDGLRSIRRGNEIHASIHISDADIGREDDE